MGSDTLVAVRKFPPCLPLADADSGVPVWPTTATPEISVTARQEHLLFLVVSTLK